jgi:hypothetical protein
LNGFGKVRHGEMLGAFEVGDSPGNFEDAVVCASGKSLLLHGALEQPLGVWAELSVDTNLPRVHLGV